MSTMNINRSALLAGATGLVGEELLQRLLAGDEYSQVNAVSRRALEAHSPKLNVAITDFDQLAAVEPAFFAVDDVFCCLGTTIKTAGSKTAFEKVDFDYVLALAQAAEHNGAKRFFLVSAVGANPKSSNFYSRTKGRIEVAVSKLNFDAVYWIRPSLLLGKRNENRPGEAWAQRLAPLFSPLLAGPLRHTRPVSAAAVAEHIVHLTQDDAPGQHISYPSRD